MGWHQGHCQCPLHSLLHAWGRVHSTINPKGVASDSGEVQDGY